MCKSNFHLIKNQVLIDANNHDYMLQRRFWLLSWTAYALQRRETHKLQIKSCRRRKIFEFWRCLGDPNFSFIATVDYRRRYLISMWTIAIALIILSPILFALLGGKTHKLKKQWNVFKVSAFASFGFIFTMKSEERLEVFRRIHSLYPRFLHFDFLKLRVLLIYDPEIAKKLVKPSWEHGQFFYELRVFYLVF